MGGNKISASGLSQSESKAMSVEKEKKKRAKLQWSVYMPEPRFIRFVTGSLQNPCGLIFCWFCLEIF